MSKQHSVVMELVGYHGTRREVADSILQNGNALRPSKNDYDWLGPGIYFWIFNPERARLWAEQQCERNDAALPAILQAVIHPQNCLNLHAPSKMTEVKSAFELLEQYCRSANKPLPENKEKNRALDCAVIQFLHRLRKAQGLPAYDSVLGIFEEGNALYPGSAFKQESHIQIAVCDPRRIVTYSNFL